jgi:23S rRNA (uridine2552-2'-O)-methyltransferase
VPKHRPQDHFGRRARREGFPARSVYKLEEIDRRLQLLRPGRRVLDLGAAPGSFTLYAAQRVGDKGRVVAVDRQALTIALPPNARAIESAIEDLDEALLGDDRAFDVVLSDMAPHTIGQRQSDQYRSFELYMAALRAAQRWLVPGGTFVGKIFQGAELTQARKATAELFARVRILKPEASRKESYELFVAGLKRGGTVTSGGSS